MNHEDYKHGEIVQQRADAGAGGLMWLLAQMIRIPLTAFVSTIEVFITSMRGIQKTTDQLIDMTVGGVIQPFDYNPRPETTAIEPMPIETWRDGASTVSAEWTNQQSQKEQSEMEERDIDLRGDDLKLLEYDIWFTKSELEEHLDENQEVIAYSTTLGDYKGTRISKYLDDLKKAAARGEPVERPEKWKKPANDYPPKEFRVNEKGEQADDGEFFNGLPQDDVNEFIKVDVRLKGRRPRDEKDEADRLKDINETLKGLKLKQA